jgi:hypothetical protein
MIIGSKKSDRRALLGERAEELRRKAEESSTTTNRARKIFASVLLGAALSLESPLASNANPLLAEINNPPASFAGAFGTPYGSTPYFNSASAARLLIDPIPSSRGSPEARRQIAKQRALQDSRLEQCRESGIDWEQCFYYGTGVTGDPAAPLTLPSMYDLPSDRNTPKSNNNFNIGGSAMIKGIPTMKSKIPTW